MTKGKRQLRIGINGLGRIGRAIFRIIAERQCFKVVAINDINPDPHNMAYLLKYDSTYGRFGRNVDVKDGNINFDGYSIKVYHKDAICAVPWSDMGVDIVIDASGVHDNVLAAKKLIKKGIPKVLITHAPDEVDFHLILGVNESSYDKDKHHVLAASICDAIAVAPVLKILDENFGIQHGFLTTLHPWLPYQNIMDGPSKSWSHPDKTYHLYVLGRASVNSLIPKPTTAMVATAKVLPHLDGMIKCFSYRVPCSIVGSADISIELKKKIKLDEVIKAFKDYEAAQRWDTIHNTWEQLVSCDYARSPYAAIVDHRWTDVIGDKMLKLVLWYDNEWGYSSQVVNQAMFIGQYMQK